MKAITWQKLKDFVNNLNEQEPHYYGQTKQFKLWIKYFVEETF